MKITTKQVLTLLLILTWVIFIGVCIEAGGVLFSAFYTLFINSVNAENFWVGNDLTELYALDRGYFAVEALLIGIASTLKAVMFYLILSMLYSKKLRISQPFSREMRRFILRLSGLTLGIGVFTGWGVRYTAWLAGKGISMPDTQQLHLGGADVWVFMAVILLIIAEIFKRGIEMQAENELTI
ncbi:MAG: DUF2975 domain-containing protein [Siphonobacter aquaeclarae]|jgi:hypothetical protein|nr:DUF2975 domain-containing protein [Siphonobacter aquaeclarae]